MNSEDKLLELSNNWSIDEYDLVERMISMVYDDPSKFYKLLGLDDE